MNSFNHYSLGSCGEWLFEYVAGIAPDVEHPGYKHTIIQPYPGAGLTSVQASVGSIYGRIASGWKLEGQSLTLHVVIPVNTTATVYVPADPAGKVTEGGKPAESVEGVTFVRTAGERGGVRSWLGRLHVCFEERDVAAAEIMMGMRR